MKLSIRLILVAAAMSAFLIAMIADHNIRRTTGNEVILNLEPVDPRDILAGYFVILSTPIHQIDLVEIAGDDEFSADGDIYVVVEPGENGSWQPVAVYSAPPSDGLYIHGKVQSASAEHVSAHYNLERYYADEETARALEERRRTDRASMRLIVSVSGDGRAIIRGLEIEGERVIAPFL